MSRRPFVPTRSVPGSRRLSALAAASPLAAVLLAAAAGSGTGGPTTAAAAGNAATAVDPASPTVGTAAGTAAAVTATTAATTAAPEATDAVCSNHYTVVAGDSWYAIASAASVTADELLGLNGGDGAAALYPGDEVCLPDGAFVTTTTPTTVAVTATTPATAAATTAAPTTTTPHTVSASS